MTSKHHDGFALFDTGDTTHRNSVNLGPGRDLVGELFEAARQPEYASKLHPAVYYSLPEWLSPDYQKYGFYLWPGGSAHNAYNWSQIEDYTGRVEIEDYIDDLMVPHMSDLLFKYQTSIMWWVARILASLKYLLNKYCKV